MSKGGKALRKRAAAIKLVVFDVDGTLTDGGLVLGPNGQEFKVFHVRDGQGMVMLREAGLEVAIVTSRSSEVVADRMRALGIRYVYQGYSDKLSIFQELLTALNLRPVQCACVGDDLTDLPLLTRAGLAVAVADAHPAVLDSAHWCTQLPGGRGAAREVCDFILDAQGRLAAMTARYAGGKF
ncbi:MAG TPA: HAD-IIIA family hydrolase [Gammaproteobacteria bacterium]|nr:HAD-IIIA family hydrolase [Gammaproteobacteria bacterium]